MLGAVILLLLGACVLLFAVGVERDAKSAFQQQVAWSAYICSAVLVTGAFVCDQIAGVRRAIRKQSEEFARFLGSVARQSESAEIAKRLDAMRSQK